MNDNELAVLLDRAGSRLDPDADRLIAGGVARGRRRQARRRAGVLAVGAVAVTAVGVGSLLLPGSGGAGDTAIDHGLAASPTSAPSSAGFPGQPVLAEEDVIRERLLAQLPPGVVSDLSIEARPIDAGLADSLEITLLVDGADVVIDLHDHTMDIAAWKAHHATQDPGPRPQGCDKKPDPRFGVSSSTVTPEMECSGWYFRKEMQQCAQSATCVPPRATYSPREACDTYDDCRELADGSWIWPRSGTDHDDGDPTEVRSNWISLYAPDGWNINVQASDGINDRLEGRNEILGHVVLEKPVLSPAQVQALATSDIWFK